MRRFLIGAFVVILSQPALAEEQKLSQAYEQQLIQQVQSVFSPTPLVELEHPICATPIFLDMKAKWDRLSAAAKQVLRPYNERPSFSEPEQTFDTPGGHFKIHFVTEGADAVFQPMVDQNHNGYPDWVDATGDVLDYVWNREVNGLGYRQPPSDGGYPEGYDNGGDGRYDVYLLNISSSYLGYTEGEFYVSGSSGPVTSYMVLDNDYTIPGGRHTQIEWMEVTAAHEFFHAVQMGYDGNEFEEGSSNIKPYWMEMSAVWMEDIVYDDINDYVGYLPSFFLVPWLSLKTYRSLTDLHAYGSCVWPIFLQESFGDTAIIRRIWEKCGEVPGDNAFNPTGGSATDIVLGLPDGFDKAFGRFTVWNYFTGDRTRTDQFYSEGDTFPKVMVEHTHPPPDYPVYRPSGPDNPYGLGSNYVVFKPEDIQGGLHLEFSPAGGGDFQTTVVGYNENVHEPVFPHVQSNSQTGAAECDVYNWTSYNDIVLIAAAADRNGDAYFAYTYSAEYDSSLHGDEPFPQYVWIGQNFPNPFVITGFNDSTYFPFILSSVTEVEIGIFSVSGELVWQYPPSGTKAREWTIGEYTQRGQCPAWDGRNQNGEYVASGVYVYRVKTKSSTVVKKLAVIR